MPVFEPVLIRSIDNAVQHIALGQVVDPTLTIKASNLRHTNI